MLSPDFKPCKNTQEYLQEWNKLLDPLSEKLNMQVYAFDPEIKLCDTTNALRPVVQIPVWFAKKILKI